jgi:hypothetical protein
MPFFLFSPVIKEKNFSFSHRTSRIPDSNALETTD